MTRTTWRTLAVVTSFLALAASAPAAEKDKKKPTPPAAADVVAQAEAKVAAGDTDAAMELLRKAPDDGRAALLLGRLLDARGELDSAAQSYESAGSKLTGSARGEALARLALVRELRGLTGARESAEAALAADPEGAWPLTAAAHLRAGAGGGEAAVLLARSALEKGAGAAGQTALGHALEGAGDLAGAEAALRIAVADPAEKLPASLHLATVLRRAGRAAEAEPLVVQVVNALPGSVEALKESARVKLALGRTRDAATDATLAAAMAEGDADALVLNDECAVAMAVEQAAAGDGEFALQNLRRLLGERPGAARLLVGVGRVHIARREPGAALDALAQAAAADPALADAPYYAGYVHHMLKRDPAAAVPHYEKAVAAAPGNLAFRRQLAGALVAANKPAQALEQLGPVLASGTPGAEALMYKGAAHLALKQYADAVTALQGAADATTGGNAQIETFLALAHFGQKNAKEFVEHGLKAKALGQTDGQLLDYLARVQKGEPIK